MSTGINYLDEVWNPVTGCSFGACPTRATCWARAIVKRFLPLHASEPTQTTGGVFPLPFSTVRFHPDRLDRPFHWKKPRRIGVCFLGDLFDKQVPFEWLKQVWDIVDDCPWHQFFFLTKQVARMRDFFAKRLYRHTNTWLGVSITSQADADRMIPELLRLLGKKWVSIEPMLGPIRLDWPLDHPQRTAIKQLDWIVLGAESGPHRRPMPLEWAVDVVEQCKAAGVPVWVKQIHLDGKLVHDINLFPPELQVRQWSGE